MERCASARLLLQGCLYSRVRLCHLTLVEHIASSGEHTNSSQGLIHALNALTAAYEPPHFQRAMTPPGHRRTDSVSSAMSDTSAVSLASSISSVASTSSIYTTASAASTCSEWVHVDHPTTTFSLFPTTSPPPSPLSGGPPLSPGSPGGRRHSVGLNLAPSLCNFNPSPHRPPPRPQLRPLILAAKYPLDPTLPLL